MLIWEQNAVMALLVSILFAFANGESGAIPFLEFLPSSCEIRPII